MARRLTLVLAALIALVGATVPMSVARADTAAPGPGWQRQVLVEVNALRMAAGVPRLRLCAALGRAARTHAHELATGAVVGHIGIHGDGPGERARDQGYAWTAVGENVAAGQRSVRAVMESWVASPGHLANLLDPAFRHMGVAVAVHAGSEHGTYWVQHFGRGGPCRVNE